MKKGLYVLALVAFVMVTISPHTAFGQLTLYDNFNSPTHLLDSSKWWGAFVSGSGIEVNQRIDAGKLRMSFRSVGGLVAAPPTNTIFSNLGIGIGGLRNPNVVKTFQATVEVVDYDALSCPGNPNPTDVQATVRGGFFNTGTPTPNSFHNDIHAGIAFTRRSSDPNPNVIEILADMGRCTGVDCSSFVDIQNRSLGSISCPGRVCPPVTVRVTWDQTGNTFRFLRFASPANIEQVIPYAYADASFASRPYRNLAVPQFVANCTAAAGGVRRGFMDVLFDNVYTAP
jgi:hypothetical protein